MYDINRTHIKILIQKYKANEDTVYDLEYLLECGLRYVYGMMHIDSEGHVKNCTNRFSQSIVKSSNSHSCNEETNSIVSINTLGVSGSISEIFVNKNLAILTDSNDIHGFYFHQKIFEHRLEELVSDTSFASPPRSSQEEKHVSVLQMDAKENGAENSRKKFNITCMDATSTMFYFGTGSGDLIYWDPHSATSIVQPRHTKEIKSVRWIKNQNVHDCVLTCSRDGTFFLYKSIKISESGLLDILPVKNSMYFYSCEDNTLGIYNNTGNGREERNKKISGHCSKIEAISCRHLCLSSSSDGYVGFYDCFGSSPSFTLRFLNCSKHKQVFNNSFFGWGRSKLMVYDLFQETENVIRVESLYSISCADISSNTIAYSSNKTLSLTDTRSNATNSFLAFNEKIDDVKISSCEQMILVRTKHDVHVLDVRRI